MPSFFDDLFAGGPRAVLDGTFGQPWQILPQARPRANAPSALDPSRPVITGIVGYFSDKAEAYRATHVYDQQADKRPGITTAEMTVEFPNAFAGAPLDIRGDDIAVRMADGAEFRLGTPRRDEAANRLTCNLGRLS